MKLYELLNLYSGNADVTIVYEDKYGNVCETDLPAFHALEQYGEETVIDFNLAGFNININIERPVKKVRRFDNMTYSEAVNVLIKFKKCSTCPNPCTNKDETTCEHQLLDYLYELEPEKEEK